MTLSSARRGYEKAVLKALSGRLKRSRWKKNQNAIFCEFDGFYFDVLLSVYLNGSKTVARMSAKPMSLDKIYWQVTGLTDNNSEPLSFRTWGAFTCSGLPVAEKSIDDGHVSAEELVNIVVDWADSRLGPIASELAGKRFSEALAHHPNQVERGAYAISYVTSLIDEGDYDAARLIAAAYADGSMKSVSRHTHLGKDFHEIAVQWIDSGGSST